jgi:WD40 repeat protein
MSINEDILLMGFTNGSFELRHKYNYDKYLIKYPHDRDTGKICKVAFNHEKNVVITTGEDGTIFIYKIDYGSFCRAAKSS